MCIITSTVHALNVALLKGTLWKTTRLPPKRSFFRKHLKLPTDPVTPANINKRQLILTRRRGTIFGARRRIS